MTTQRGSISGLLHSGLITLSAGVLTGLVAASMPPFAESLESGAPHRRLPIGRPACIASPPHHWPTWKPKRPISTWRSIASWPSSPPGACCLPPIRWSPWLTSPHSIAGVAGSPASGLLRKCPGSNMRARPQVRTSQPARKRTTSKVRSSDCGQPAANSRTADSIRRTACFAPRMLREHSNVRRR